VGELGGVGQQEDDERDVGLPGVGSQLTGRLGPPDQPLDQGQVPVQDTWTLTRETGAGPVLPA